MDRYIYKCTPSSVGQDLHTALDLLQTKFWLLVASWSHTFFFFFFSSRIHMEGGQVIGEYDRLDGFSKNTREILSKFL